MYGGQVIKVARTDIKSINVIKGANNNQVNDVDKC